MRPRLQEEVPLLREGRCAGYERQWCARTHRAPWVCNGCGRRPTCPLGHFTHSAKVAQAKADERLVEPRRGLDMTGREMAFLAQEVKAGLARGQSVHHVFALRDDLPCSERSSCRHVENEGIDVAEMGLRKKARYKRRYRRKANRHEKEFYRGREYADYLALPEVQRMRTVEMDCVEGAEGDSQALLTPRFVQIRSQIYILLKGHGCAHVVAAPDWLEGPLGGPEAFRRAFGLILTDRGSEFDDVGGIERNGRCHVFYADPQRSGQKGACEKNHVELRKVIPQEGNPEGYLDRRAWARCVSPCRHLPQRGLQPQAGRRRRLADGPREGGAAGVASRRPRPCPRPARRGRDAAGARRTTQEGARQHQRLARE